MQIDLRQIKNDIGAFVPFTYTMSIADVEPSAPESLQISGEVRNRAGVMILSMTIESLLSLVCDRCLKPIKRRKEVFFEAAVADHVEGEEVDSIIVCENDLLELDDLVASSFILELDSKNLCREDCAGLCPTCGADLNESTCNCNVSNIDPRLEKLRELLGE